MKTQTTLTTILVLIFAASSSVAQDGAAIPDEVTLFKNVSIFDGTTNGLKDGLDVLVVRDRIQRIAENIPDSGTYEIEVTGGSVRKVSDPYSRQGSYTLQATNEEGQVTTKQVSVNVIDGQGMTLMPGLIDSHVHFNLSMDGGRPGMEQSRWDRISAFGAAAAQEWFADGFTTVRDMGGMSNGLQRVIDQDLIVGPRIYLCGGMISQTSGHADMLLESQTDPAESNLAKLGIIHLADGPDEVRRAVRRNFNLGATHVKVMMAGGVAGAKSPTFASQYTDAEIVAAVEEAATRDAYVAVHVYRDEHIRRALNLGVMSVEHGQFMSEDTARLMKEKGAFISPYIASVMSDEILTHPVYGNPNSFEYERTLEMKEGTRDFVDIVARVKPNIVFSSDVVSTNGIESRKHRDHEKWIFAESFGNYEALIAMTSMGGELAMLTGRNNPYPHRLGVIEEGAYADILIVDGNPLEDITVLGGNPEWFDAEPRERGIETIRLIMKNGKVYKNTLQ
ncbi:MAG: amidohydrolase family protein [Pirellulaceae bacterium]